MCDLRFAEDKNHKVVIKKHDIKVEPASNKPLYQDKNNPLDKNEPDDNMPRMLFI
jgi:hypothetical protein